MICGLRDAFYLNPCLRRYVTEDSVCLHIANLYLSPLQVEKNEEADQKIEQDGNKPEDKAHKAATKIQASFRGHITRKKMKDGEKEEEGEENTPAATEEEATAEGEEKKEATSPVADKAEEAPAEPAANDTAANEKAKSPVTDKPTNPPAASPATSPTAAAAPSEPTKEEEAKAEAEEKPKEAPESKEAPAAAEKKEEEKGEPKQADVPAADASETTDCEESNQTQDKKGEQESGPSRPKKIQCHNSSYLSETERDSIFFSWLRLFM